MTMSAIARHDAKLDKRLAESFREEASYHAANERHTDTLCHLLESAGKEVSGCKQSGRSTVCLIVAICGIERDRRLIGLGNTELLGIAFEYLLQFCT